MTVYIQWLNFFQQDLQKEKEVKERELLELQKAVNETKSQVWE